MNRRMLLGGLARAALVSALACQESTSPEPFYGTWGGDDVRLTLSITQALFESSCWRGELPIPFGVEGNRFTTVGTLTWVGGAGMTETRFGTFAGLRTGDRLSLTISPASLGLGPYELMRGTQVQIPGCPAPAGREKLSASRAS